MAREVSRSERTVRAMSLTWGVFSAAPAWSTTDEMGRLTSEDFAHNC
jgi:hypothetical protein